MANGSVNYLISTQMYQCLVNFTDGTGNAILNITTFEK